MAEGRPLLEIRCVAYLCNRQPVAWRISHVNTERYEYLGHEPWEEGGLSQRPARVSDAGACGPARKQC